MIVTTSKHLIGKGPSFPYNRSESGGLAYTEDIDRINQSLFILFETPKGSRLMMPEFGSDLDKYRFEPLDAVLMESLKYSIKESIARWEPRVIVDNIAFLEDPVETSRGVLYVSIDYLVIKSNVHANYVYPYRLGTYDTLTSSYK